MLSKCANPDCTTPFHYLRDGRLFQIETPADSQPGIGPKLIMKSKQAHRVEFFWLCSQCASMMTLAFERGKGVVTVPLPVARHAAAS